MFVPSKKVALCRAWNAVRQCACGRPWLDEPAPTTSAVSTRPISGPTELKLAELAKLPHHWPSTSICLVIIKINTCNKSTDWGQCLDLKPTTKIMSSVGTYLILFQTLVSPELKLVDPAEILSG